MPARKPRFQRNNEGTNVAWKQHDAKTQRGMRLFRNNKKTRDGTNAVPGDDTMYVVRTPSDHGGGQKREEPPLLPRSIEPLNHTFGRRRHRIEPSPGMSHQFSNARPASLSAAR